MALSELFIYLFGTNQKQSTMNSSNE